VTHRRWNNCSKIDGDVGQFTTDGADDGDPIGDAVLRHGAGAKVGAVECQVFGSCRLSMCTTIRAAVI